MGKRKEIKSTSKIKIEVENENLIKLINDTVYKDFLIDKVYSYKLFVCNCKRFP